MQFFFLLSQGSYEGDVQGEEVTGEPQKFLGKIG